MEKKPFVSMLFNLTLGLAFLSYAAAQGLQDLAVQEPRPMMAIVDQLQAKFGIAINYEDPPFQNKTDIVDVTNQVQSQRQREANPNVRILIPRGGALSVALGTIRLGQIQDASVVLERASGLYEAASFPGKFQVSQTTICAFVEPLKVRLTAGEWTGVQSVLSVPISIVREKRTAADTLTAILAAVRKAGGARIDLAAVPMVEFASINVEIGGTTEPARNTLMTLFQQMSASLIPDGRPRTIFSYRLLFDPGLKYYMISVAPVPNLEASPAEPNPRTDQTGLFGRRIKK